MSFYIDMTTVLDMFKTEIKVVSCPWASCH